MKGGWRTIVMGEKRFENDIVRDVKNRLFEKSRPEKIDELKRFFKALPGGYGEGDEFLAVTVPEQRKIAKQFYKKINLEGVEKLLQDKVHEVRLTGLFILTYIYEKSDKFLKEEIVKLYLNNLRFINNWDLVDSSAHKILGDFVYIYEVSKIMNLSFEEEVLKKLRETTHPEQFTYLKVILDLADDKNLWARRVSIISTFYFIKKGFYDITLYIIKKLIYDKEDLIHKACGWMLREIGNRNREKEILFLKKYYKKMPRVMLRYAIEKFEKNLREEFLKR